MTPLLLPFLSNFFPNCEGDQSAILSETDRQRIIEDRDIVEIADLVSHDWLSIALRLPDASRPHELAFKPDSPTLKETTRDLHGDGDKMAMVLHIWRAMCPGHKWGHLWDVLHGRGHGTSAKTVLAHSKTLGSCEYCIASVCSSRGCCVPPKKKIFFGGTQHPRVHRTENVCR